MFKKKQQMIITFKEHSNDLTFKNIKDGEQFNAAYKAMVATTVAIGATTDLTVNELMASVEAAATQILGELAEGDTEE